MPIHIQEEHSQVTSDTVLFVVHCHDRECNATEGPWGWNECSPKHGYARGVAYCAHAAIFH